MKKVKKYRTHTCGELTLKDVGKEVVLSGWIKSLRWHGGMIFVNLFDRYGEVQLVFNRSMIKEDQFEVLRHLNIHSTIGIKGVVKERPENLKNPHIKTGDIEVIVKECFIYNKAKPLPIPVEDNAKIYDESKLRWRPIYLRRKDMQNRIILRSKVINYTMHYLFEKGFVYIETPILAKPTPEGARDFLVPSRLHTGKFYALPQSPQQYKQKLMIAGFDKYYQIAKCLRDEDLRADRQPEFTQIDIEMSWVEPIDIFRTIEDLLKYIFRETLDIKIKTPFPIYSYDDVINKFGTDKPDLRFKSKIVDLSDIFKNTSVTIFREVLNNNGVIKCIKIPKLADKISRKYIDKISNFVRSKGDKGVFVFKFIDNKLKSQISKHLSTLEINRIIERTQLSDGDLLILMAGRGKEVSETLGEIRLKIARDYGLLDKQEYQFLWVVDFPMFEYSNTEERWVCVHHPFTSPKDEHIEILMKIDSLNDLKDPSEIRSKAYDLVLNGWEVGGGSIRIHDRKLQEKIFKLIGLSPQEYMTKFGSLLELLDYGAPVHGGIALGLDRLVAIMAGVDSIREVIAFPKNKDGRCLMDDTPSTVSKDQLKELHLCIDNNEGHQLGGK